MAVRAAGGDGMSEWQAKVAEDWQNFGVRIMWMRDLPGVREVSDGKTVWTVTDNATAVAEDRTLHLNEDMARSLLAALLKHYNGADDARMLRKDYDAERARVDKLTDAVMVIARAGR